MALPTAYLTSTKNLEAILNAIQAGKAPPKFTQRFLEELGFKAAADRLVINVLKSLGFLSLDGAPTQRYFEFLDQSQGGRVLAEALEETYADLYRLHREAHTLPRNDLIGKVKTITQGRASESVVGKMVSTFTALGKLADFSAEGPATTSSDGGSLAIGGEGGDDQTGTPQAATGGGGDAGDSDEQAAAPTGGAGGPPETGGGLRLGGLVYNIELHLPESRDPAVYEALFRALKEHLVS